MRMDGHVEEFLYYEKAAGKAEATLRIRRRSLQALCQWLADHDLDLAEVSSADLVAFVNSLLGRHVPDAVNQYISSARLFFRWLAEEEITKANPAARLRFMHPPIKPVESLSDAECRKLVSWCVTEAPKDRFGVHRTAALALLLLDTGMRIGEALRLRLGDVDFAEGKLLVHATKTNDFRVLPLSPLIGASEEALSFSDVQRQQ
jgi:site-specific recombinase XerD